ncbi:MAG: BACON domain-containing protein [Prevotella sp.]|nr:BACON domain-containing protein [Prevotella sp.]
MKRKLFWGSAILCCTMAFGFISCSDDDDKNEIKVDEMIVKDGITSEFGGGIFRIPVTGGSWTASVPEEDDWVIVVRSKGNSGDAIALLVEGQYEGISRNTTLTVKSGDNTIAIPIKQIVNKDNAENLGLELSTDKGLGFGYDVVGFKKTGYTIMNIAAIEEVQRVFPIKYSNLILDARHSELRAADAVCDSTETKHDSLGVRISVTISYGTFKMGISGAIKAGEKRNTYANSVNLAANYPLYDATVNLNGVLSAYEDWVDEGKPELTKDGHEDFRGSMLTSKFIKKVNQLNERAEETEVDNVSEDTKMKNLCADIVSLAGSPAIVSSAQLGGSYMLKCSMDTVWTKEYFDVDQAKATAEIKAAVFQLDAEVQVDYEKQMVETLKHCYFEGVIKGGTIEKQQAVYDVFLNNPKDFTQKEAINNWAKSIKMEKGDGNSNVELINVELTGVWNLLERSAANYMKQYVKSLKKYKDSEIISKMLDDDEEE